MPCNLSTQKRTNRVEDFVEEDFVEFMLSLCWVYFGLLLDDFQTLGNRSNLKTWAIMEFPLDFSGISH